MGEHGQELVLAAIGLHQRHFGQLALGDVDQHVDTADHPALGIVQRCRIGPDPDARAVRALVDDFDPVHGVAPLEHGRHRRLTLRQQAAVSEVGLPAHAPLVGADLRRAPGQLDGRRVEVRQHALHVGRVDGGRHRVDHLARAPLAVAQDVLGSLALGDVENDRHGAKRQAVDVAHEVAGDVDPDGRPVLAHQALVHLIVSRLAPDHARIALPACRRVVRVGQLDEGLADQFRHAVADEPRVLLVDAQQPPGGGLGLAHAHAGHGEDGAVLSFAFVQHALVALERVDVHQHQHGAVHLLVERLVGAHAQREPAPVLVLHLALLRVDGVDDLGDERLEVDNLEAVPDMADGAPDVGDQQVELFFGLGAEAADPQVAAEQHDRLIGRGLHIDQVAAEAVELCVAITHLIVERGELLVGGLQFFLRRGQFLVEALQLLVGGLGFFVGRLQLFTRRFEALLDGLQVFARLGQIVLELGDAALVGTAARAGRRLIGRLLFGHGGVGARRLVGVLEQHQETRLAQVLQRNDFQVCSACRAVLFDANVLLAHGRVVSGRLGDGRTQGQHQSLARHLQHVETRRPGGRFEVGAGDAAKLQNLPLGIDEYAGRSEVVDRDAVGFALGALLGAKAVDLGPDAGSLWHGDPARMAGCVPLAAVGDRQGQDEGRRRGSLLDVDLLLSVQGLEQLGKAADRFRPTQPQKAVRLECVVKNREQLLLHAGLEIDQQIAAGDDVDARERRIADEVLPREYDHLAQRLDDAVAAALVNEEALQSFRREVRREALGVQAVAGLVEQRIVEIGGEHLQLAPAGLLLRHFNEGHRDGVSLLAGGATEHPHAECFVAALRQQPGQDLALQHGERVGVAKEAGHADQHVGKQRVELPGVAVQELRVLRQRVAPAQQHAPRDAALDGARLVEREIDAAMVAQQGQHALEAALVAALLAVLALAVLGLGARAPGPHVGRCAAARWQRRCVVLVRRRVLVVRLRLAGRLGRSARDVRMLGQARELERDRLGREHEIDAARGRGAARHRVVLGRIVLREGDAAFGLDGLQPERAVGRGAGEDDPDGAFVLVLGQRLEKEVDRAQRRARLLARLQLQHARANAQLGVGRYDVDVIRLDAQIVRDLAHRHDRGAREQLGQRTFVQRVKVLHQDEGHAGVHRQMREQLGESLQATGRGADADDRKRRAGERFVAFVRGRSRRRDGFAAIATFLRHVSSPRRSCTSPGMLIA